jgi:hypothetical protein
MMIYRTTVSYIVKSVSRLDYEAARVKLLYSTPPALTLTLPSLRANNSRSPVNLSLSPEMILSNNSIICFV